MSDSFDAAEIVFEVEMLVGSVSVFVGKAKADEHAGNLEGVIHLGDERNGAAFTNEDRFFLEAFFQSGLGALKDRSVIGSGPGLSGAEHFKFAFHGFWQKLANMFFNEPGDARGILAWNQAGVKFGVSL